MLIKQGNTMDIYSEKIKLLKDKCIQCMDGSYMHATGNLYYDNDINRWIVEFACDWNGALIQKWHEKYEPNIKEALQENGIS